MTKHGYNTLIKVGGSITERGTKEQITNLGIYLSKLFIDFPNFVIVPGGGIFVEDIREMQKKLLFTNEIAHWMAILGMEQHGLLLHSFIPKSNVKEIFTLSKEKESETIPILSIYNFMKSQSKLEHSWNATSDAIAIEIAYYLNISTIIFLKGIDGLLENGKLVPKIYLGELFDLKTSPMDRLSPMLLSKKLTKVYLINGFYPERIGNIFRGEKTITTEIITNKKITKHKNFIRNNNTS